MRAVTATDKTLRHVTEKASEESPENAPTKDPVTPTAPATASATASATPLEKVEPELKPVSHKGYARRLGAALKERLLKAS